MHNRDRTTPSVSKLFYEKDQNQKFLKSKELVSRLDRKFSKTKIIIKISF